MTAPTTQKVRSPLAQVTRRVLGYTGARIGLVFLFIVSGTAILAPFVGFDALTQNVSNLLQPPSRLHWFGTDELGRDILARTVHGARTSLFAAVGAVIIASTVGVPIGLIAGFFAGWRDAVLMRIIDVMLALPTILLAMALIAVLGRSQITALIAVGVVGIPSFARITRAQVLSLKNREYVTAVESMGGSSMYSMFRTVLPNSWSPILVQVVILASLAILLEAALAFLGLGVPPPTPSWGEMLRTGKSYLRDAPYYAVLPGIILTGTILSLDTLGRTLARVLEDRNEISPEVELEAGIA
jgi:ABC-type dipeptide/oligopeptide/nickel transport system permease subunit